MKTHVNFNIAKLLKDKGFDEKCSHYYINNFQNFKHDDKLYKTSLPEYNENENILQFVKRTKQPHLLNAPTIAEILCWLYEKRGVWVSVDMDETGVFYFSIAKGDFFYDNADVFNSPTSAYEAAILYSLNKLI